jgi:hypothetical protein
MKVKLLAGLLAVCISLFFACHKENTDTTNIIENPVSTDTVRVSCDSLGLFLNLKFDSTTNPVTATLSSRMVGGVAPFKFLWSTGETSNTIRISSNGTYGISITDSRGCTVSFVRDVIFPSLCGNFRTQITQTPGTTFLACYITGGTAPYSYRWSTGATTPSINTSGSGTFSLVITDRNGCTATHQITIGAANCSSVYTNMGDGYQWTNSSYLPMVNGRNGWIHQRCNKRCIQRDCYRYHRLQSFR